MADVVRMLARSPVCSGASHLGGEDPGADGVDSDLHPAGSQRAELGPETSHTDGVEQPTAWPNEQLHQSARKKHTQRDMKLTCSFRYAI